MGHGYGGITNNFIFYFLFIYTITQWVHIHQLFHLFHLFTCTTFQSLVIVSRHYE